LNIDEFRENWNSFSVLLIFRCTVFLLDLLCQVACIFYYSAGSLFEIYLQMGDSLFTTSEKQTYKERQGKKQKKL
jgi:hypothetical protein